MKLDKFHDSSWMRLAQFYNPTVSRIDLSIDSGIRAVCKLTKSLIEIKSKMHEPKTYDQIINYPIHRNRWREVIDEKLWNLDSNQI